MFFRKKKRQVTVLGVIDTRDDMRRGCLHVRQPHCELTVGDRLSIDVVKPDQVIVYVIRGGRRHAGFTGTPAGGEFKRGDALEVTSTHILPVP